MTPNPYRSTTTSTIVGTPFKASVFLFFFILLLAACGSPTPTPNIPTLAALPTETKVPTADGTVDPLWLTATQFVVEATLTTASEETATQLASSATMTATATASRTPTAESITSTLIPFDSTATRTPIASLTATVTAQATVSDLPIQMSANATGSVLEVAALAVMPTELPTMLTPSGEPASPTVEGWHTAVPTVPTPTPDLRPTVIGFGSVPTPLITAIPGATFTPTPTPTITLTASASPFPTPIGDASVTAANSQVVNLMSEPSLTANIIEAVSSGENVFLIGRSDNNEWYEVRRMNGNQGWIYGLYLVVWMDTNRLVVTHFEPTEPPVAMVGGFALGGHVMNLNENAFSTAREAGMSWIKIQHRYYNGERGSAVASIINTIHRAGFRVVLGVVGDRAQLASIPGYHAAFAEFVAGAAQAGADAIEIWNEPNIDREWPRGFIHGGNYTELLRAAYTAIKAVSPATIVISAAPAPTGFFGPAGCGDGGCNDDIFLTQMAFAGAQNYLDCVGLHHNDGIVSPTQMTGDPRGDHPTYFLRGVMSRVPSEFNSRPICFTEVGYLSPEGYGPLPPNFAWANGTSVAEHAQWIGEAVRLARASGRVQMLIVWNIDFNVYTHEDPMAGWAIRRRDGSCPACAALVDAMR